MRNTNGLAGRVLLGFAGLAALAGFAPAAKAALIVDFGGAAPAVTDNGPGDSDLTSGRIISNTVVAGFGVSITVAASNSPGTSSVGVLNVQTLNIQNLGGATASLTVRVSDNNYTAPGAIGWLMDLASSAGGTFTGGNVGDSLSFQSFADGTNAQPATAFAMPVQPFSKLTTLPTESFDNTITAQFTRGAAYSLTNITSVTLSAGAQASFSGNTTATAAEPPVPEPTGVAALLLGGLLATRRRR